MLDLRPSKEPVSIFSINFLSISSFRESSTFDLDTPVVFDMSLVLIVTVSLWYPLVCRIRTQYTFHAGADRTAMRVNRWLGNRVNPFSFKGLFYGVSCPVARFILRFVINEVIVQRISYYLPHRNVHDKCRFPEPVVLFF